MKLNRLGDYREAVKELREVAEKIRFYAGSDPELNAIWHALRDEEGRWAAPAPELLRKMAVASANYSMRSRGLEGNASRQARPTSGHPTAYGLEDQTLAS